MGEARVATAVRLPATLLVRLRDEAEARDVSVNWLLTRAAERFLASLRPVEDIAGVEVVPGSGGLCERCGWPMNGHGPHMECPPRPGVLASGSSPPAGPKEATDE